MPITKVYSNLAKSSAINYPPGPSSRLPLKLFFDFLRDPLTVLHNLSKEYGDISHIKFGKHHIYLINNPDYIKNVLVDQENNYIKSRGLQLAKRILGEGLLTSESELHHRQRQLIQPVFQPDEITSYAKIMTDYTLNISSRWYDYATIDIHKEFMHLTLAIVSKTFFNVSIKESQIKEIDQYVTTIIEHFNRARMPFAGIIEKVPLPSNMRFHHAKKHLDKIIYRIIDSNINSDSDNDNHSKQQNGSHYHKDLISLLLQDQADDCILASENKKATNKSNKKIHTIISSSTSRQQLRDNVMTIFLAGHETVVNALTWTFYLLSQNPKQEKILHEEVDSVLDDDNNDRTVPTVKDISKLEYTQRVFAESMRLYPPVWAIGRQATKDCKIGDYVIPAGSSILMSQYLMHHNPLYFPEPERFDPERWNPQEKAKRPRFSYFPFGGGVRSCIGETFAWMEGILIIATIARRWKMRIMPGHPIVLQPLVTLRPKYGMQMRLIDRNNVGHI
jgi:cytochrome P450